MKKWLALALAALVVIVAVVWGGGAYKRAHFLSYLNNDLAPALAASLSAQAQRKVTVSLEKATEDQGAYTLYKLAVVDTGDPGARAAADQVVFENLELAWSGLPQKADVTLRGLSLSSDRTGDTALVIDQVRITGMELNLDDRELSLSKLTLDAVSATEKGEKAAEPFLTDLVAENYRAAWDDDGKISGAADREAFVIMGFLVDMRNISGVSPAPGVNLTEMRPGTYNSHAGSVSLSAKGKRFFTSKDWDFKLNKAQSGDLDFKGGVAHMSLDPTALPEPDMAKTLAEAGYQGLEGSQRLQFSFGQALGAFQMDFNLVVAQAGEIQLSLMLNKAFLPQAGGDVDPAQIMAVEIKGASLCYKDDSLVGRILGVLAKQQGIEPTAVQQREVEDMRQKAAAARQENLVQTASLYEALAAFLGQPDSLSVSFTPAEPVAVGRLATSGSMENAWRMLGLGAGPCTGQ